MSGLRVSEDRLAPDRWSQGSCPSMNHPGLNTSTLSLYISTWTLADDVQSRCANALMTASLTASGGSSGTSSRGPGPSMTKRCLVLVRM